jgi:hypothetical protein
MRYRFDAEVWRWEARVEEWGFVSLPQDVSDEIREYAGDTPRGFGAVRVEVSIGDTTWRTSIFPGGGGGPYILPLKKAVRKKHDLSIGAQTRIDLEILD